MESTNEDKCREAVNPGLVLQWYRFRRCWDQYPTGTQHRAFGSVDVGNLVCSRLGNCCAPGWANRGSVLHSGRMISLLFKGGVITNAWLAARMLEPARWWLTDEEKRGLPKYLWDVANGRTVDLEA
jgi:hypothetical protein